MLKNWVGWDKVFIPIKIEDYIERFKTSGLSLEQINILDDDALRLKLFPDHSSVVVSSKAKSDTQQGVFLSIINICQDLNFLYLMTLE